jgi:hypothetical protein
MKLNSEFRRRIIESYFRDKSWNKIIHTIDQNEALDENVAELSFVRESATVSRESDFYMTSNIDSRSSKQISQSNETQKNSRSSKSVLRSNENSKESVSSEHDDKNLIYHVNRSTEEKRLCISSDCVLNILIVAHEREQDHSEFEVTFEIISRAWYIRDLIKTLRFYIRNCSQCLQIQIRRHRSWESLQLIHSSSISFHTITMNFVLELFKIKEKIDCVLSMTDKFTKRIMLISEKFTYTTENWAVQLLEESQRRDWDISKVIISDKDRKFLSDLWRTLFTRLRIFMLYFTAYHSQTNEASERTNQTLEIALRYYIQKMLDSTLWILALWKFQSIFNNTRSTVTRKTSNELLYEITSNLSLNISFTNKVLNQNHLRKEAEDAIDWAQMQNKAHYDRRHTSLFLKIDEWVLLRLHHEYFISRSKNMTKKIFTQYIESFKIIQRIKRLIYRLDISSDWKIHSVFFVTQLKLASNSANDSYHRSRSTHSSSMTNTQNEYEIERILNKRTVKRDQEYFTKYLVRWQDYEFEYDRWYNVKNLQNAKNLISDYEKKLERFNSSN